MQRVDFSTVMNIIIENCRENMHTTKNRETAYSQFDFLCDIFYDFYTENDDVRFDNSAVSRWIKGNRPIPAIVVNYYRKEGSDIIGDSFQDNCLKLVFDRHNLYNELVNLVRNDYTLSEEKKAEILPQSISEYTDYEICSFVGKVIFTAIDRPFIPADKAMLPTSAIAVSEYIFGADVPAPCKYFCGRDNELSELDTALQNHNKIFITGFAGIGKSEFAKAYAKKYKKEYKNILYFNYSEDLKEMIADIEFACDSISDDEHTKFTKHIRFLKSLKTDSLIIIDNFNSLNDSFLSTLLNYSCKMIFTTRCNVEYGHIFELDAIKNPDELYRLVSKYFTYADENKSTIIKLIEAVHSHTLSVEMIGKLLEKGIHTPDEILEHLMINSADPESSDKIKINKDGENTRATYYNHIRTLFSLYLLSEDYQNVMRNMIFFDEVRIRYFAKMLELNDTNGINELCELGFINNTHADIITLHPMIRDIVLLDLKPDFINCNTLINAVNTKLKIIGYELPDSAVIISTVKNIMKFIGETDSNSYLNILESAYVFLDNYHEYAFMEIIISETEKLLDDKKIGNQNNHALLLSNKAMLPVNRNEKLTYSISLMNKALPLCDKSENIVLFANINMNLGVLYIENKETERGLEFMEKAWCFIRSSRSYNDDFITISRNYAAALTENSYTHKALEILLECAEISDGCRSNNHANIFYDIAGIYIRTGKTALGIKYYNIAFDELTDLGSTDEVQARKVIAATLLNKFGVQYPAEWENNYLE